MGNSGTTPVAAMRRLTLANLKKTVADGGTIGATATANIIKTSGGDTVGCTVQLLLNGSETVNVAADNGKVRTFKNLDDSIKGLASWALLGSGTNQVSSFALANTEALDAKPFTGDPVVKATKTRAAYIVKRDALNAISAALTTAITLMPEVTTAEQALVAEKVAQRDAIDGSVLFYMAEIDRINGVLGA